MKAYILTESDFERLKTLIDRNPTHGYDGGSGRVLDEQERRAHDDAHRFYNYQVHKWLDEVKK